MSLVLGRPDADNLRVATRTEPVVQRDRHAVFELRLRPGAAAEIDDRLLFAVVGPVFDLDMAEM